MDIWFYTVEFIKDIWVDTAYPRLMHPIPRLKNL